ncbi:MAG TPA: 16S rRNA (guanine(966)-N(2))-methyltransferase RsmD [Nitrospinota bacterium]|nr:16S rRNA (guanine(966)-N(2))-methyltransferase RsmD [Nitrospinota bacterium]
MRVISGNAKGRKLVSFKGSDIRPTSDRARESLFNILKEKIACSSFLDLFAGSGAIGIEALSRGAENMVFVENRVTSIALIKKNLEKCGFSKSLGRHIKIIHKDVLIYLKTAKKKFDIIFIDPPYQTSLAEKSLLSLSKKNLLKPDGIIILEQYFKRATDQEISGLQCVKRKKVGDAFFSFFNKTKDE